MRRRRSTQHLVPSSLAQGPLCFGRGGRTLLLSFVVALQLLSSIVLAVDKSKFRTCQQTSFCRRHRLNVDTNDANEFKGPTYKVDKNSVIIHHDMFELPNSDNDKEESSDSQDEKKSSSWTSRFFSRSSSNKGDDKHNSKDNVRLGPKPYVTASLIPTTSKNYAVGEFHPPLQLSLSWQLDGSVRIQVTEPTPRYTTDDLVLTEIERANPIEKLQTDITLTQLSHEDLNKLFSLNDKKEEWMGFQYSYIGSDDKNIGAPTNPTVVAIKLEPTFEVRLYSITSSVEGSTNNPMMVSLNSRQLLHFEHVRTKDEQQQQATKKKEDDEDRHKGKEIVGYWEDGLAIYADGTREEKPIKEVEEEEVLTKEEDGLWEESFQSHHDSKPRGPMSVGMDITFGNTDKKTYLYGLAEHATKLSLPTTIGSNRHYNDPYRLYNLDVFEYDLDVPMSLYGAIPMIMAHNTQHTVGVFYFNPTETFVDVSSSTDDDDGSTNTQNSSSTHWISESGIIDIFLLPGPTPRHVFQQYAALTGYQELPPMFALGYHQCRWNYRDTTDVYNVHGEFESLNYPYDVLWLDIEHTNDKRYFTWDSNAFSHPIEMQHHLWNDGRRMVTIVDPHVKRDPQYYIHSEATKLGYYIKDSSGTKDFDGWCWPGSSSYLDFTQENVRRWWSEQFHYDKYQGSTPSLFIWNDMNEPSVFNGPEVTMSKDLLNLNGIEHREWHNIYGMLFHRATSEGIISRSSSEQRPFVLSRSFFSGSQKYGAIWTGDNAARWDHLEMATPMLLSLNVGALSFVGADVGGFFGDPTAELMSRWIQSGSYQPFFRGHAHHDSKRREPWIFGNEWMTRMKHSTSSRYALLPYLYTIFYEASTTGMPVMRSMFMEFPHEENMFDIDDQWMLGHALLIKPVVKPSTTSVVVHFPTKYEIWYDVDTNLQINIPPTDAGTDSTIISIEASMNKIPVFQRGGSIVLRKLRLRRSTDRMTFDPYTLYIGISSEQTAFGTLYMDDEVSLRHVSPHNEYAIAHFSFQKLDNRVVLSNDVTIANLWEGAIPQNYMIERIVIMGWTLSTTSSPKIQLNDGRSLKHYTYNSNTNVMIVRKPLVSTLTNWTITMEM